MTPNGRTPWQTFRGPALLAVTTIVALLAGLLAEGGIDWAAAAALAAVPCWCFWRLGR